MADREILTTGDNDNGDGADIALTVDDERWNDILGEAPLDLVSPIVHAALAAGPRLGGPELGTDVCLGLTFTDDEAVRTLNRDYRDRDNATNVLSFALQDGEPIPQPDGVPVELGDLVLAYDTILQEADLQGCPVRHHLLHLIAHGVLHLLGYDHLTDTEAEEMERIEIDVLARFSIPNPYQEDTP
ncbi:rRNA maturation RNase YbeY [Fodinicurvata sp. EGI_FJ10296]|uniref:rRNA maturation RNase YbeY n=1 Tax=Fodinicurvata sp. EGI_FJ10296 TaxID=3231908 RepID=UPI003456C6FB